MEDHHRDNNNNNNIDTDNLYSVTQEKILFALPIIPGILSAICSGLLLYVIFSDAKRKLQHVYHRALVGFSIIDMIVSVVYAASSLPVPKGTPGTFGAIGNWTTCQISGFLLQFSLSLGMYWAFICLYYVSLVRYRVREKSLIPYEVCVHVMAFLVPLTLGIILVNLNMYNPTNIIAGHCFVNCYPANCLRVENVECERGEHYFTWSVVTIIPVAIAFPIVVFSTILTCQAVRKTQMRQNRWNFSSSSLVLPENVHSVDQDLESTTANNNNSLRGRGLHQSLAWTRSMRMLMLRTNSVTNNNNNIAFMMETTRQVYIQSFLYIASYFAASIPYILIQISTLFLDGVQANRRYYFSWTVLVKIFLPSTGIWNFLIYCRPRVMSLRKQNPEASALALLRHIIFHSEQQVNNNNNAPILSSSPPPRRQPPMQLWSSTLDSEMTRLASHYSRIQDVNRDTEFTPELEMMDAFCCREENKDDDCDDDGSVSLDRDPSFSSSAVTSLDYEKENESSKQTLHSDKS
jgi:hypothetical protein